MPMQEKSALYGPTIYDQYPYGFGEVPGPTTTEDLHWNKRVNKPDDLSVQVGRFGPLRRSIKAYTSRGLSVGVQFAGPRKVRMLISERPELIKKGAAVIGVTAGAVVAAGVVYLHERHKPGK